MGLPRARYHRPLPLTVARVASWLALHTHVLLQRCLEFVDGAQEPVLAAASRLQRALRAGTKACTGNAAASDRPQSHPGHGSQEGHRPCYSRHPGPPRRRPCTGEIPRTMERGNRIQQGATSRSERLVVRDDHDNHIELPRSCPDESHANGGADIHRPMVSAFARALGRSGGGIQCDPRRLPELGRRWSRRARRRTSPIFVASFSTGAARTTDSPWYTAALYLTEWASFRRVESSRPRAPRKASPCGLDSRAPDITSPGCSSGQITSGRLRGAHLRRSNFRTPDMA